MIEYEKEATGLLQKLIDTLESTQGLVTENSKLTDRISFLKETLQLKSADLDNLNIKLANTSVQMAKSPIKDLEPNSFLDGLNIFEGEEEPKG